MKGQDTYDRIEAYMQGKLDGKETTFFEEELQSNEDLASDYKYHQITRDALINERLLGVKNILEKKRIQNRKGKTYGFFAVVSALLTFTAYYYYQTKNDNSILNENVVVETKQHILNTDEKQKLIIVDTSIKRDDIVSENLKVEKHQSSFSKEEVVQSPQVIDSIIKGESDIVAIAETLNDSIIENPVQEIKSIEKVAVPKVVDKSQVDKQLPVEKKEEVVEVDEEVELQENKVIDEIEEETTVSNIPKKVNLEISPEYNEYEEFPFEGADGLLQIYSRRGDLVQELEIVNGNPRYWDGKDKSGNIKAGYYIYKFQGTEEIVTGGITVIY